MNSLVYAAVMLEERDADGRLIYAPTSNYSKEMRKAFPGPRRAKPRADASGTTPPVSLQSGWPRSDSPYSVPGATR